MAEMGTLTLSADHRVVDGAVGAAFFKQLVRLLGNPDVVGGGLSRGDAAGNRQPRSEAFGKVGGNRVKRRHDCAVHSAHDILVVEGTQIVEECEAAIAKAPPAFFETVHVVIAQRCPHGFVVAHHFGVRVDDTRGAAGCGGVELNDMVVREMIAGAEYGEASMKLSDHRLSSAGIHDAVLRAKAAVAGETLANAFDIASVDGEAIMGDQFADLGPRFQPCDALIEVHRISSPQPVSFDDAT